MNILNYNFSKEQYMCPEYDRVNETFRSVLNSEVCQPRCVFKLYGEGNSVKNTTINIWLNDGVY